MLFISKLSKNEVPPKSNLSNASLRHKLMRTGRRLCVVVLAVPIVSFRVANAGQLQGVGFIQPKVLYRFLCNLLNTKGHLENC